jgi:hypothetical protein
MIVIDWQEREYQVEDGEDSDEPYSYRGETDKEVWGFSAKYVEKGAKPHYGMSSTGAFECDAKPGDVVFAVVVRYATGDTFGRDGGQTTVMDVFTDAHKATGLYQACQSEKDFSLTFEGKQYYVAWNGYFETLESVDIQTLVVRL